MLLLGLAVRGVGSCRRKSRLGSGSLVLRSAVLLYGAFVVAGAAPDQRQLPFSGGGLALSSGGTLNSNAPKLKLEPPRAHEREHLLDQEEGHPLSVSAIATINQSLQPLRVGCGIW